MHRSTQASLTALLGLLGCSHAGPEPTVPVPSRAEPTSALTPAPMTDPAAPPAPNVGFEIPAEVLAARQVLLRFREHDAAALARARALVDAFEAPRRYEERGELDGRPYYYARDAYDALGIVIHHDGERITNVEPTPRSP